MNEKVIDKRAVKQFRDLNIWKKGIELVKNVYVVTNDFPKEELYGLSSQMRRSSVSVPSNIAEGFRRKHNKEYRQFLYISLGSLAELETQLVIADNLNYISRNKYDNLIEKISHLSAMIMSLIKKL